jgi:Kef-type K+ transport system membrane component KefB
MGIIYELAIIIGLATVFAFIARMLKQPYIPAYVLVGVLVGPSFGGLLQKWGLIDTPGFVTDLALVHGISEIGLTFLLFIIGLELSFDKIKDVKLVASLGAIVQFLLVFTAGFLLSLLFFDTMSSIFLGLILAFGSTMVVINILGKKKELDSLHGRIALGTLLTQDIIAILIITLSVGFSVASGSVLTYVLAGTFAIIKAAILIGITYLCGKYFFPIYFKFAARSQELLLLSSISIALIFALMGEYMGDILVRVIEIVHIHLGLEVKQILEPGLSLAIGAFLGGVAIGTLPYSDEIASKMWPIKDFFVTIFFVSLGIELVFDNISNLILPIIVLLLFLVLIKPYIIAAVTAFFGYDKRTSFITGISLFQVSEFGIIILSVGYTTGLIKNPDLLSVVILLAAITMMGTSYVFNNKHTLFNKIGTKLQFYHFIKRKSFQHKSFDVEKEVVLFGYDKIGYSIFKSLVLLNKKFLVVDHNPSTIKNLVDKDVHCLYGDANNTELLEKVDFRKTSLVISTIPIIHTNKLILQKAREHNKKIVVFVTVMFPDEALKMYEAGADYVILPDYLGGDHVSLLLEDMHKDTMKQQQIKFDHIQELTQRFKEHAQRK